MVEFSVRVNVALLRGYGAATDEVLRDAVGDATPVGMKENLNPSPVGIEVTTPGGAKENPTPVGIPVGMEDSENMIPGMPVLVMVTVTTVDVIVTVGSDELFWTVVHLTPPVVETLGKVHVVVKRGATLPRVGWFRTASFFASVTQTGCWGLPVSVVPKGA